MHAASSSLSQHASSSSVKPSMPCIHQLSSSSSQCSTSGRENQWHRAQPAQHRSYRRLACQATPPGKDGGKGDDSKKADFSAYWSMKIRGLFSVRRKYLDSAEAKEEKTPALMVNMEKSIAEQEEQLLLMKMERQLEMSERAQAAKEAGKVPFTPAEEVEYDMQAASSGLRTLSPQGLSFTVQRAQRLVQGVLMAPFLLITGLMAAWQQLFKSQKYEMYLMSEGERVWYWRNRTENERWFWEMYAWRIIAFPTLCTLSYMYIVPDNLIWTFVVPFMFHLWQQARLPTPLDVQFWLIMYLGVYKKSGPQVAGLLNAVFSWA